MYDIITIGSATQDVFLKSKDFQLIPSRKFTTGVGECFAFGSKIDIQEVFLDTGGGATNAAATFKNLGYRVAVLSRIGNDSAGTHIIEVLRDRGIDTSLVITDKHVGTAYSTILLTGRGERTVLVYRGASSHFHVQEIPWHKLYAPWLYLTSVHGNINVLHTLFDHAEKNAIRIGWNPGGGELKLGQKKLAPFFSRADIIILNREEAGLLTRLPTTNVRRLLRTLIAPGARIVAMTDSKRGAYLAHEGKFWYAPSLGRRVVNATGAGDAFGSALTAGIAKGFLPKDALRLAILNSGLVVAKMGAKNGLLEYMPSLNVLKRVTVKKFGK
ncbi:carbohydrate kinase family protein [Candidatus Uhrbacteria bacterium]|nr:carbohydrate kinase family protein [Candidatus Uhrbacteria bacterium]